MTAGTFFTKFAGKIVKIIGLLLLAMSFITPLAGMNTKYDSRNSGYGNSEENDRDVFLIAGQCFNKLDKKLSENASESEVKAWNDYVKSAKLIFPQEAKKAPVSVVDIICIILVSVAAICSLLIEVIPGLKKAKLFSNLSRFGYWLMLLLGTASMATIMEVVFFGTTAGLFTIYGWITLAGLVFLIAGENFAQMVDAFKTLKASDKKAASTYVALLSTPIVFIAAMLGAGYLGSGFFAARFFMIPGAIGAFAFGYIANAGLKKALNK